MSPAPAPLFFCLRLPEFAAQSLLRLRPQLGNSAVAVLEGELPLERSCATNLAARRLGVCHRMTRTELESIPHLILLRRSHAEEESAAAALLELAGRFTPRAQQLPRTSAHTLVLDLTGTERLFGPPRSVGHKILRAIRELGLHARAAASENLHTAACLVRATGDTLRIVAPGAERGTLHPLPLTALGLTQELADTFNAWGLRTVGDLAALPPTELVARLGQQGHRLHRLARGEEPHLLVPEEPSFILAEHLGFDSPVHNLDSLLFVLGPMLDQLILRARSRALLLASLTATLHLERSADSADRTLSPPDLQPEAAQHTHERTLKPALPLDNRTHLLKLLHLDLQAHPAPAAIVAITLTAEPGERPGVQSGLFAPQLPEPLPLEITLARIAALVGEARVGQPNLLDTHSPENFRVDRLTVLPGQPGSAPKPITGIALRRLRPPRPVHIWQQNGRLSAFALRDPAKARDTDTRYTIRRAFGPWRRSGQWWSGHAWSQEEWDIDASAADGTRLLCLLSQNLLKTHWQMEALYD